ncbi:transporter substrate-binding domain-containing protein [Leisingera aquaemixtae]|uniref:transporter substrate-binding domain-containing protein n=1 Tax=Leisingera aquaemixtae TaxID=1396826 RepID=UPI0021A6F87F|nr:transporter substrate-binding domain-containing protein [Leisingera aquaemixtae]UWQ36631.1 transporter substrate-binding domain-containing protein [Leisingera aquaemixtae]
MKALAASAVLAAFCVGPLAAQSMCANCDEPIRMGVRADVPPFVWKDPASGHFRGFFWDICTTALTRAGYRRETVEITAGQRANLLASGNKNCTAGKACRTKQSVDLLCDPTTITLARMETFAGPHHGAGRFVFSPILYVANGAYIQQAYPRREFRRRLGLKLRSKCPDSDQIKAIYCSNAPRPPPLSWLLRPHARELPERPKIKWPAACETILEALDTATETSVSDAPAPGGSGTGERSAWDPPQIWPEQDPSEPEFEIWGYVEGATIGSTVMKAADKANDGTIGVCAKPFASHGKAAEAFCEDRIYRYFGDVDLVRAAIDGYTKISSEECNTNQKAAERGTYEPYALLLSQRRNGFPEAFNLALYSMFTDGTIGQMFDGRFGGQRRSQYLDTLFRINSVPDGKRQRFHSGER